MASVSLDQPEAGPSSLKRPRLEERITTYEEDAISLGDDEPFAHEPSPLAVVSIGSHDL